MSFSQAGAVARVDDGWVGEVAEGWDIAGVSNGGYQMSIVTRAMAAESGRELLTVTGHFLNPTTPGPVHIRTETLKTGKLLTTMRAVLSRDDRPLLTVTGVLSEAQRQAREQRLKVGEPPDLPDPDECVRAIPSTTGPFPPPFTANIDLRIHPDDANLGATRAVPQVRGWFRLLEGETLDAHALVLASDAFLPAVFNSGLAVGWTPTVDLSVQVRDPHPEGWLACRFTTRFVTGNLLEEDGEMWNESGRLVALSRQLALLAR